MMLPDGADTYDGVDGGTPSDGKYDDDSDEDQGKEGEGKEDGSKRGKGKGRVISLDWYDGAEGLLHPQVPTLCLALEGGIVQTSRGVEDVVPIVINTHMTIRQVRRGRVCILHSP